MLLFCITGKEVYCALSLENHWLWADLHLHRLLDSHSGQTVLQASVHRANLFPIFLASEKISIKPPNLTLSQHNIIIHVVNGFQITH